MALRQKTMWFERLFGVEERFENVKTDLKCEKSEIDGLDYITGPNKVKYCAGRFEHASVSDLVATSKASKSAVPVGESDNKRTRLDILNGDIVKFINDPKNNGAVFQVASQFNCLEFINSAIIPEHGVARYEYDHTQGPACSIAAGPATVYRNYFVEMPKGSQIGQTEDNQLNGFEDIGEVFVNQDDAMYRLKNGYLTATSDQLDIFNKRFNELKDENGWQTDEEVQEKLWNKLKLGVHYDVEVTSSNWGEVLSKSPQQRITQVFSSAAAVGYSRCINRPSWATLARGILDATYEGIFCVGEQNPTKTIFLTFVGGGVFQNSMTWICDAIEKAAVRHQDSGLKVYLVCYGGVPPGVNSMVVGFNQRK